MLIYCNPDNSVSRYYCQFGKEEPEAQRIKVTCTSCTSAEEAQVKKKHGRIQTQKYIFNVKDSLNFVSSPVERFPLMTRNV